MRLFRSVIFLECVWQKYIISSRRHEWKEGKALFAITMKVWQFVFLWRGVSQFCFKISVNARYLGEFLPIFVECVPVLYHKLKVLQFLNPKTADGFYERLSKIVC